MAMPPTLSGTKTCCRCREPLPLENFYAHRGTKDGRQGYCKPCQRLTSAERNESYRARRRELARKDYRADPEKFYWRNVFRNYGITKDQYEEMFREQDGACAVCLTPFPDDPIADRKTQRRIYVDHCHATNKVRGLLCPGCNTAVGLMKDDPANAVRVAEYLRRSQ